MSDHTNGHTMPERRRVVGLLVRIVVALGATLVVYTLLVDRIRGPEISILTELAHRTGIVADVDAPAQVSFGNVWLLSHENRVLMLNLSRSCSAAAALVALGAIAIFVTPGPWRRRGLGLAAGAAALVAVNFVRMLATILVGLHASLPTMTVFHDWVGTIASVVGFVAAVILLWWISCGRLDARPAASPA